MTTPRAAFASRACSADLCSAGLSTSYGNVSCRSLGTGRASVSRWERLARRGLGGGPARPRRPRYYIAQLGRDLYGDQQRR